VGNETPRKSSSRKAGGESTGFVLVNADHGTRLVAKSSIGVKKGLDSKP
jgi:hypothetical protein